jgi:hypothetical protein
MMLVQHMEPHAYAHTIYDASKPQISRQAACMIRNHGAPYASARTYSC